MMAMDSEDPLEGSSYRSYNITVKTEIIEEIEHHSNTMSLLKYAQNIPPNENKEHIEFNSTDVMTDPKSGLIICLHCFKDFNPNELTSHMVNIHNYRTIYFKCHNCLHIFQDRKLLITHRKTCNPDLNRCKRRKSLHQIMKDAESINSENSSDVITCQICYLELQKSSLQEHLLAMHSKPEMNLTCGRCNRNFKSKITLREHVKFVHDAVEDSEECELCGQKFRSVKYLANHKRNVHPSGDKLHICPDCGKQFKSRLCLHQHTKYVHPPESAAVLCPHCPNKYFKSHVSLQQHLKVSHGIHRKGQTVSE